MDTKDFISKLEKNPSNPTVFKLRRLSDQERQQFLADMLSQRGKHYGKFVHRILRSGISDIKNFTPLGKQKAEDINRINNRLINSLPIFLSIELFAEIMQFNFSGGFYGRR